MLEKLQKIKRKVSWPQRRLQVQKMRMQKEELTLTETRNDENDVNEILKKKTSWKRYLQGGTRSFDSNLLVAKSAFKGMLMDNNIYNEGLPTTSMDTVTEALEDKAKKMLRQSQVNIKSLTHKIYQIFHLLRISI